MAPLALLSCVARGRTVRESLFVLQLGKPLDRIDGFLDPLFDVSPPFPDELTRVNHISRYQFAFREFKTDSMEEQDGTHLDVACGLGYANMLLNSIDTKRNYVGVDISSESLRYAYHHYGKNASFVNANASLLPFGDNSFETATCFETLEHVPDDEKLLQELKRVLHAGSSLVISVPNNQDLETVQDKESMKKYPHVNSYNTEEFRELLFTVFDDAEISIYYQNTAQWDPKLCGVDSSVSPYGFYKTDDFLSERGQILVGHVTIPDSCSNK